MKEIKITLNGKTYNVQVGDLGASPVDVQVDGKSYQVEIEDTGTPVAAARPVSAPKAAPVASAPVTPAAAPAPAAPVSGSGIRAPMPGTIVNVDVQPGDKVARGQQVLALEAMKMKNSIKSPVDAVIKAVHVTNGQKVQFNDMLVSFE